MNNIENYFKIKPNDNSIYKQRLIEEIQLFEEMNYLWFIKRIADIYNNYINKYPNLLRGSAGSSLLLYYMGLNLIDPIENGIPLERFVNKLRKSIPDIDIDLPSSIRTTLIDDIIKNNNDTIRMTCNSNNENNIYFEDLIKEVPSVNYIHNSGVIIYSKEQENIIKENKISPIQIKLTTNNINDYNLKKIDLLSNTAIEQLYFINKEQKISEYDFKDEKLYKFISEDDGIGITYAETQSIQNIIKILKPCNIEQLSLCLALVRPFACHNISEKITYDSLKNEIIYDDDFIMFLNKKLNYNKNNADEIRRLFKNNTDKVKMNEFIEFVDSSLMIEEDKIKLKNILYKLPKYSFCKAHSINHSKLIYCLYWNKYYNSKNFWISTIKNIKGYYKDWVYIRKGLDCGLKFKGYENCNSFYHYIYTGYWLNNEFMTKCYLKLIPKDDNLLKNDKIECEFRGLIAGIGNITTKYQKQQMIITIGYDNNKFINLHLNKKRDFSRFKQVIGKGYYIDSNLPYIIITKITLL
jgi:DNA polymerase III alpha subunit